MLIGCLIGLCILIYVLLYLYKWKIRVNSLPPGPPAWPVLGNILQLDANDVRKTFNEWHKKYGGVFTFWMGLTPAVVIADYDLMNELFIKRGDEFVDRPTSYTLDFFVKGKYGIVNLSGDSLREQRRFTLQTLRNFGMGKKTMENKIATETEKMIRSLEDALTGERQKVTDVTPYFRIAVTNVISSILMGKTFATANDPLLQEFIEHIEDFGKLVTLKFQILETLPWLRHIPLFDHFGNDELTRQRDWWVSVVAEEIERHKKNPIIELNDEEPSDFVSAYLNEIAKRKRADESLGYFDEWQLTCIIMDLWQAGYETTVTTLSWAILLMIRYPHIQTKVQEELDSVVGRQRLPGMNDRNDLPYTNAVLHELQRYTNIAAFTFGRMAKKHTNIAGFTMSEDIPLLPSVSAVLMDERYFAQPEQFKPERFLENGSFRKVEQAIPFSLGKRSCVGEALAKMELFLIFTALLQNFVFSSAPSQPEPTLEPFMGIVMKPQKYECIVSVRP